MGKKHLGGISYKIRNHIVNHLDSAITTMEESEAFKRACEADPLLDGALEELLDLLHEVDKRHTVIGPRINAPEPTS